MQATFFKNWGNSVSSVKNVFTTCTRAGNLLCHLLYRLSVNNLYFSTYILPLLSTLTIIFDASEHHVFMGFFKVNGPYHSPHLLHSDLKLHFSAFANLVAIFHLHSAFQNLMKSFVKIIWKRGHNLYIELFYTWLL